MSERLFFALGEESFLSPIQNLKNNSAIKKKKVLKKSYFNLECWKFD